MLPVNKMAFLLAGTVVFASLLVSYPDAWGQSAPPVVGEEMKDARGDFAQGGIASLNANWDDCVNEARASQDANNAERCVVYGYSALLLGDVSGAVARTPWARHLTADIATPVLFEMLGIMGIPDAPRQAWLERYRRWVSVAYVPNNYSTDAGNPQGDPVPRGGSQSDMPYRGARNGGGAADLAADNSATARGASGGTVIYTGGPYGGAPLTPFRADNSESNDRRMDLAQSTAGKYPREALREVQVADRLRGLVGPALFGRLQDYGLSAPMESIGPFTIGLACEPRACGVSEARYVFSAQDVWLAIVDGRRLRIYGNPPRQVRALLSLDRNQTAWRGTVVDMTQIGQSPVIRASAEPVSRPLSLPEPPPAVSSDTSRIKLQSHHGTFEVPATINGTVTMPFSIDSGASDVSVSADVMQKLIQSGTVSRADFRGKQIYHLADGSTVSNETFVIHSLKVGDREVRDVIASVGGDADSLLLGLSFLKRFRSWSIDNQRQMLVLK